MNTTIAKLLATDNALSTLILRVPVGLTLAAHGAQKLFSWFGGYGLEGTGQWLASVGYEPGYLMALMAGSGEFFGGLLLALGLLTRPAALLTGFTMAVAVHYHWPSGFFMATGGIEYALTLLVASAALLVSGGGRWSVDGQLQSTAKLSH